MSDKELKQEDLQNKLVEFVAEYPNSAIAWLIGNLVGLLEYSVEEQGGDSSKEIVIDGVDSRDITIHAKKGGK